MLDLGVALCYWSVASLHRVNVGPGWFSREEFLERYGARTGRDLGGIVWYEVFAIFKLAVILQQIYFRFVRGQTRDERFRNFDREVRDLIAKASSRAAL